MRGYQASFASGEISPLLHGRIDLTRYTTGLSRLENMIVLPQGGVTRRAGFTNAGNAGTNTGIKLIPFVYNATDSAMLEFGNNQIRVWTKSGTAYGVLSSVVSPYSSAELKDLRYVQSGNVIFLSHRDHKPMMLTRESMTSWRLEELAYHDGPFISGSVMYPGTVLKLSTVNNGNTYINYLISSTGIFTSVLTGTLMNVEYAVNARTLSFTSQERTQDNVTTPVLTSSEKIPVKGTINVSTSGDWAGTVSVYRNDVLMRQYVRTNPETQGQWDITISETEDDAYYHVTAKHGGTTDSGKTYTASGDINFDMTPVLLKMTSMIKGLDENYDPSEEVSNYRASVISAGTKLGQAFTDTGARVFGEYTYHEEVLHDANGNLHTYYVCDQTGESVKKNQAEAAEAEIDRKVSINTQTVLGALDVKMTQSGTQYKNKPVTVMISTSGFLKKETYRIQEVISTTKAKVQTKGNEESGEKEIKFWSIGAWNGIYGYPCAVAMYQDRLIFAGSKAQPQTIWMSKTGDYADFGTSDPLKDDDAINITLAGSSSDGIHSLVSAGSLLAFTRSGEWQIRGSSEAGAITPSAISAYESTTIGSKNIQPLVLNGKIIMIQSQGQKVYALGYDLNTDGYTGSELSIMSAHIFEGKEIISMAYQKTPDSLIWFSLSDGTAAVCTYNPEHEVIGWSRQSNPEIKFSAFSCIPGEKHTELFSDVVKDNTSVIMVLRNRIDDEDYRDDESEYESVMQTLRITGSNEDGVSYASKKLIARLVVYGLKSKAAWAAPKDWERRQRIRWNETDGLRESEIELDNGFDSDACIQIRNAGNESLTIAAISPVMTTGG